jgi:hypothetical protein
MAKIRALAIAGCLCGLFTLGADAAWAGGGRFGGWGYGGWGLGGPFFGGPRFWGPSYAGPRYDGPEPYDMDPPPPEGRAGPPAGAPPAALMSPPPGPRKCYNAAESRERVASANLHEPFGLMRKAAALTQAEALAGKLCRWNDQDIYEITLLRRDGALVRVYLNAATGAVVGPFPAH